MPHCVSCAIDKPPGRSAALPVLFFAIGYWRIAAFEVDWNWSATATLLALSMFGFYELQMPAFIQSRLTEVSNRQQGGSLTLNFKRVGHFNSAGLALLLQWLEDARRMNVALSFQNLPAAHGELASLYNLSGLFGED